MPLHFANLWCLLFAEYQMEMDDEAALWSLNQQKNLFAE